MVQWRRFFDVDGDTQMTMVSAMAISPDSSTLAVVGTTYSVNYSNKLWIWTVSTADGRYLSDATEKELGREEKAEHVVWD